MNAVRTWPSSRWLRSSDLVLALVAGGAEILGTLFASRHQVGHRPFDAMGAILLAVGALGLIVRRRYPEVALAAALGTTLAYWTLDYRHGPIFLVLIIAFFSAALSGRRLAAWTSLAVGYATFPWLPNLVGNQPRPSAAFLTGLAAWLLILGVAAEGIRFRRQRFRETARIREEEARRRAGEERLRIARDLHDVLAHDISLINVQAGVALHLIDERPEQARTALAAIKHASKDALGELRSVLDVLRTGEEPSPRGPAPTLARLDELLSGARASGLTVRTEVAGQPRPLPPGVDLAGFRVAQEALTNVVRHAGATAATLRITYEPREIVVQVEDDGRGSSTASPANTSGTGSGITGMRERAAALGGTLEAGPRPGGGFSVTARLPTSHATHADRP